MTLYVFMISANADSAFGFSGLDLLACDTLHCLLSFYTVLYSYHFKVFGTFVSIHLLNHGNQEYEEMEIGSTKGHCWVQSLYYRVFLFIKRDPAVALHYKLLAALSSLHYALRIL